MLDRWDDVVSALRAGHPCAAATIVRASGSVPRPAGTSMIFSADGTVYGSLTGGCVEAAVLEAAREALADGLPRTETFGFSDGDAFAVGLSCGGSLDVRIQPLLPGSFAAGGRRPEALLRRLDGPGVAAFHTGDELSAVLAQLVPLPAVAAAARLLLPQLEAGRTGTVELPGGTCGEPAELFLECATPAPRLYLVGANDYSAAMAKMGALLGYRTVICDPRPAFTDPRRFPGAERVVVQWPDKFLAAEATAGRLDARSSVCVLSHDAKFDVPALTAALASDAAYVGAMGSRRSHLQRMHALRQAGVPESALNRLSSPIGLDIGAVSPEELALSVFAELTAARSGATGLPLTRLAGPIHRSGRADSALPAGAASPRREDNAAPVPLPRRLTAC